MSLIELIGVALGLSYVLLAMRENPSCWIAALLSSLCYIEVFFSAQLYTQSALQIVFIVLSIRGLYRWKGGGADPQQARISITKLPFKAHLQGVVLVCLGSIILGTTVSSLTHVRFAFIDSAITVFSIYATCLETEKFLENWLYWIVVDSVAMVLYLWNGLYLTVWLYGVYVLLSVVGYIQWKRRMTCEKECPSGSERRAS